MRRWLINALGHSLIFLVCGNLRLGTFSLEISAMFWANNYITSKGQIYPITSLEKFTTRKAPHVLPHILDISFSIVLLNRLSMLLLLSHFSRVRPHRRQPTRLPHPWDSPGKNTGVDCHFLLQFTKVKSESEGAQLCPTVSDPLDCSPPGSSVHGVFQARVLEWGAIAFSETKHKVS